jgi:hypothetical protein
VLIRFTRLLVIVGVALLAVVGVAAALQPTPRASTASAGCGFLRVDFKPEGSGGAMSIRATKISCKAARRIVTRCVKGTVSTGWTVVTDKQTLMTKGTQRITYTPVGGGGCGAFTKNCGDFSYRGVGFFNLHVLGPACSSGRSLARSWYSSAGRCSFNKACTLKRYRCNARRATVTCRRSSNGYRVDWQMGE